MSSSTTPLPGPSPGLARPASWTLLALLAVSSTAAAARSLTLALTPDPPTWQDESRLRIAGEVITPCGPEIVSVGPLRPRSASNGVQTFDLDLFEDPCHVVAPPQRYGFVREVPLGRLLPWPLVVRVRDLADGEQHELSATVHEVATLGLEPLAAPVGGQPLRLALTHKLTCFSLDHEVRGQQVRLFYGNCPILPTGPAVSRTEIELPALAPGDYELLLFDHHESSPFHAPALLRRPLRIWDAAGCVPGEDRLCLHRGRFRIAATWRAFDGGTGVARPVPLAGNEGSGLLWFFAAGNAELTVKLLDACALNQRWWVFLSSASTVEYEVTVTDTASGATRTYGNGLGEVPALVADTGAFDCP